MGKRAWIAGIVVASFVAVDMPQVQADRSQPAPAPVVVVPPIESPPVSRTPSSTPGSFSTAEGELPPTTAPALPARQRATGFDEASSVEVVEDRTADRQVWRNADGTRTLRAYTEPRFFQAEGSTVWEPIDSRLVPVEGQADTFVSAANSWSVRFAPLDAGGVEIVTVDGVVQFAPTDGAPAVPVLGVGEAANTVTYRSVWPGVDVRYTVFGDRVKEDLIVHGDPGRARFEFDVMGADLVPVADAPLGALAPAGALGASLTVAPPEVRDRQSRPVDSQARPTQAASPIPGGSRVSLAVDEAWLASLAPSDFPVVLDPSWFAGRARIGGTR